MDSACCDIGSNPRRGSKLLKRQMKRQISKLRTHAEKKGISHIYDLPLADFLPHLYWIDLGTSKFLAGWKSFDELLIFKSTFWKEDLSIYRIYVRPSDTFPKIEPTTLPIPYTYKYSIDVWENWDDAIDCAKFYLDKDKIKWLKSMRKPKLKIGHVRITDGKEIKLVPDSCMSFESLDVSIYIGLYISVF